MKKVSKVELVDRDDVAEASEISEELRVALADVAGAAREGLLALSVEVGLRVAGELMAEELQDRVGTVKHAKDPNRSASYHGTAPTSVVLGGRKVPMRRPRARTVDGEEVTLESFQAFADEDLLDEVVAERMLAGLSTRRYRAAAEPVGEAVEGSASSTSRSSVSRRFITRTRKELEALMSRDLEDLEVAALMIDGVTFAEATCVVALAITTDGTKVPVGLWLGSTENKRVVTDLLADLVDRGLDVEAGVLIVIDGAKALAAAVRDVFGDAALIQRCTLHKRRNVADYLPEAERVWVDRKLAKAFHDDDPDRGLRAARDLASALDAQHPDAAGSLREGLEDMFTVARLGITGRLAKTLTTTNPIESMISVTRDTTRRVKRWRDGKMIKRWMAAGMLNAERSFRRVKGCKQMPHLVAALARHAEAVTPQRENQEAA